MTASTRARLPLAKQKDNIMAIYHLSVKAVSRSAGRSATAAAAYRAGCEIADKRTGEIHDYTRKGGVQSADIVLPDGAPEWAADRSALWNAAEAAERRKDACVAREFEVALPDELSPAERRRLAVDFAKEMANREGCAVDVAIHAPGKEGDSRNHHAHILRTTRKVGLDGLTDKLDTEKAGRNRAADLDAVRTRWAELTNERLRENGIKALVDHRSLKDQGIDREPTSHMGPAVSAMERRGVKTEVSKRIEDEIADRLVRARADGIQERELAQANKSIIDLSGDLAAAKAELQTISGINPRSFYHPDNVARREQEAATKTTEEEAAKGRLHAEAVARREVWTAQAAARSAAAVVAMPEPLKRAIEPAVGAARVWYAHALENVTTETLATVSGLLPAKAIDQGVRAVTKEIEIEVNNARAPDLDAIRRQVLADPGNQRRLDKAAQMEAKAKATQEHIAGMGSVKRMWFDTKGMTEDANKLLADAKLERAQVNNAVELSPQLQAAHKQIAQNVITRKQAVATTRELVDVVQRSDRGQALYDRQEHIYRIPESVGRVIEKARTIAPNSLQGMQLAEVERMTAKAVDVAWMKPEKKNEFEVRASRFVLPAEERRKQQEKEQAQALTKGQGRGR